MAAITQPHSPTRSKDELSSEPPRCVQGLCLSLGIRPALGEVTVSQWRSSLFCLERPWRSGTHHRRYTLPTVTALASSSCSVCLGRGADTVPGSTSLFFVFFFLHFFTPVAVSASDSGGTPQWGKCVKCA